MYFCISLYQKKKITGNILLKKITLTHFQPLLINNQKIV